MWHSQNRTNGLTKSRVRQRASPSSRPRRLFIELSLRVIILGTGDMGGKAHGYSIHIFPTQRKGKWQLRWLRGSRHFVPKREDRVQSVASREDGQELTDSTTLPSDLHVHTRRLV